MNKFHSCHLFHQDVNSAKIELYPLSLAAWPTPQLSSLKQQEPCPLWVRNLGQAQQGSSGSALQVGPSDASGAVVEGQLARARRTHFQGGSLTWLAGAAKLAPLPTDICRGCMDCLPDGQLASPEQAIQETLKKTGISFMIEPYATGPQRHMSSFPLHSISPAGPSQLGWEETI